MFYSIMIYDFFFGGGGGGGGGAVKRLVWRYMNTVVFCSHISEKKFSFW